jgi:hypothetical protein
LVGIPALECREGLDGVRPQRDALAHEDRGRLAHL